MIIILYKQLDFICNFNLLNPYLNKSLECLSPRELTIAEVSATFVGFSGVVGVFGERTGKLEVRYQRYQLFQMIVTGLSALAMSVNPFLVAAFGFSEPLVWRISSGIYVFFGTLLTILVKKKPDSPKVQKMATK